MKSQLDLGITNLIRRSVTATFPNKGRFTTTTQNGMKLDKPVCVFLEVTPQELRQTASKEKDPGLAAVLKHIATQVEQGNRNLDTNGNGNFTLIDNHWCYELSELGDLHDTTQKNLSSIYTNAFNLARQTPKPTTTTKTNENNPQPVTTEPPKTDSLQALLLLLFKLLLGNR